MKNWEKPEYGIDLSQSSAALLCIRRKALGAGSAGYGPRLFDSYGVYAGPAELPIPFNYSKKEINQYD